jgi:hypothetical protein
MVLIERVYRRNVQQNMQIELGQLSQWMLS